MSPSTVKAIDLVAKRSGDDAEFRHRIDDARLDIFAGFFLVANGPNRRGILVHTACPPEKET